MPILARSRRAVLVGGTALLLTRGPAHAHAILEASTPPPGGTVPTGPVTLTLTFNSRIDHERSALTLTGPDQSRISLKLEPDGAANILAATVALTPGAYTVRWQVLAVDGHITRGDVPFTVSGH